MCPVAICHSLKLSWGNVYPLLTSSCEMFEGYLARKAQGKSPHNISTGSRSGHGLCPSLYISARRILWYVLSHWFANRVQIWFSSYIFSLECFIFLSSTLWYGAFFYGEPVRSCCSKAKGQISFKMLRNAVMCLCIFYFFWRINVGVPHVFLTRLYWKSSAKLKTL